MTANDTLKLNDSEFDFFADGVLLGVIDPQTATVEGVKQLAQPTIIGHDEGGFYTDVGYVSDEAAKKAGYSQWISALQLSR